MKSVKQSCETKHNDLVDIQFAMSNYVSLQRIKEIKEISEHIQEIDFNLNQQQNPNKKLMKKREELFYKIFNL